MNSKHDDLDILIEAMVRLQNIPMTAEMHPQVRMHFEIAARMAEALLAFDLDEREEPATVYYP